MMNVSIAKRDQHIIAMIMMGFSYGIMIVHD